MTAFHVDALRYHMFGPVSFSVDAAECVGLTGPSGSGKSLMLRSLADLDPHEGRVRLDGVDQEMVPPPDWRRRVGLLPAESQWWHARVGEHFPADAGAGGAEPSDGGPTRLLADLGFAADVLDWEIERLSSGEKQRLALLRLLRGQPRVLLLDEPTANLDRSNVEAVETLLARYRQERGAAVVWVSHDVEQLRRVTTRILRLRAGTLEPEESE